MAPVARRSSTPTKHHEPCLPLQQRATAVHSPEECLWRSSLGRLLQGDAQWLFLSGRNVFQPPLARHFTAPRNAGTARDGLYLSAVQLTNRSTSIESPEPPSPIQPSIQRNGLQKSSPQDQAATDLFSISSSVRRFSLFEHMRVPSISLNSCSN